MYVNKCIKCGAEFETKNPKRVICPNCLYSDKKYTEELSQEAANASSSQQREQANSYSFGAENNSERKYKTYERPERGERQESSDRPYSKPYPPRYNRNSQGGSFQRPYNNRFKNDRQRQGGGYNRPQGNRPRPNNRPRVQKPKQLLVSKEQIDQIEILYKKALPLPNPDIHEVIGQAIGLEPRKVFFGINLVRQKLMLPKLPFPKRKLAVSPDQLFAIKNLYEPLLPLPPIGCHKIIAAQLRMDEWRVHVGIGLIRKQMGLDRWNQDREDIPAEHKKTE